MYNIKRYKGLRAWLRRNQSESKGAYCLKSQTCWQLMMHFNRGNNGDYISARLILVIYYVLFGKVLLRMTFCKDADIVIKMYFSKKRL